MLFSARNPSSHNKIVVKLDNVNGSLKNVKLLVRDDGKVQDCLLIA
jgi:hypothetical protein